MAKGRKKQPEAPLKDTSRIMFLSLNMILLAFFILLVALSQTNETKEAEIAIQVRKAFQSFGGAYLGLGTKLEESGVSRDKNPLKATREVEQFIGELTRFVQENEEASELSYVISSEGLSVHLFESFAFKEGTAELIKVNRAILNSIHDLILRTTNPVRIEGHTDNRELRGGRYADSWELSAARAMAVYRYFQQSGEIPPGRFTTAGYGSTRPLLSNLTESGRGKNRRVTITLVGTPRRPEER